METKEQWTIILNHWTTNVNVDWSSDNDKDDENLATEFIRRVSGNLTTWDETHANRPKIYRMLISGYGINNHWISQAYINNNNQLKVFQYPSNFPGHNQEVILDHWKIEAFDAKGNILDCLTEVS